MPRLKTLGSRLSTQGERLTVIGPDSWRATKATAHQRGYGYKWQKAREGWLRHHPLCAYCEREGRVTEATVVDHIKAHRGDMALFWNRSNWMSLCATCHSSVKQREENAQRRGQ
ncbi:HNH endonuclease [Pseudomonas sp. GD03842]|uniref:HNH endonuclease n=1 Tax=Pseudomonas sp. GD03842 TaxID=2975385 RepID=UPI00244B2A9D|nr:HNH endonuclease signature motif containing protein [Pseudomonas sp. GD03842]MDH0745743.1 HNH endonuclease [Pseudomonas sp. GD03842]